MKIKYILGILMFFVIAVGSACAAPLTLNIDQHGDPIANIGTPPGYNIYADYSGNTIHVYAEANPGGTIPSEFGLHKIDIELPAGVDIDPNGHDGWDVSYPGHGGPSIFGDFTIELKNNKKLTEGQFTFTGNVQPVCNPNFYAIDVQLEDHEHGKPNEDTGKGAWYAAKCPETPIPEFPTVALPVAAILGLALIFGRRKKE